MESLNALNPAVEPAVTGSSKACKLKPKKQITSKIAPPAGWPNNLTLSLSPINTKGEFPGVQISHPSFSQPIILQVLPLPGSKTEDQYEILVPTQHILNAAQKYKTPSAGPIVLPISSKGLKPKPKKALKAGLPRKNSTTTPIALAAASPAPITVQPPPLTAAFASNNVKPFVPVSGSPFFLASNPTFFNNTPKPCSPFLMRNPQQPPVLTASMDPNTGFITYFTSMPAQAPILMQQPPRFLSPIPTAPPPSLAPSTSSSDNSDILSLAWKLTQGDSDSATEVVCLNSEDDHSSKTTVANDDEIDALLEQAQLATKEEDKSPQRPNLAELDNSQIRSVLISASAQPEEKEESFFNSLDEVNCPSIHQIQPSLISSKNSSLLDAGFTKEFDDAFMLLGPPDEFSRAISRTAASGNAEEQDTQVTSPYKSSKGESDGNSHRASPSDEVDVGPDDQELFNLLFNSEEEPKLPPETQDSSSSELDFLPVQKKETDTEGNSTESAKDSDAETTMAMSVRPLPPMDKSEETLVQSENSLASPVSVPEEDLDNSKQQLQELSFHSPARETSKSFLEVITSQSILIDATVKDLEDLAEQTSEEVSPVKSRLRGLDSLDKMLKTCQRRSGKAASSGSSSSDRSLSPRAASSPVKRAPSAPPKRSRRRQKPVEQQKPIDQQKPPVISPRRMRHSTKNVTKASASLAIKKQTRSSKHSGKFAAFAPRDMSSELLEQNSLLSPVKVQRPRSFGSVSSATSKYSKGKL
ncbi:hypothetical protein Ciccas_000466 [Cichlidogyrus casuarinus]|uniref:Uncharacterized protein n=1 Tax=Cichlidogyrus casuarinus TaxID=1844966 RepID=A0ABD2QMX1_9PLAT